MLSQNHKRIRYVVFTVCMILMLGQLIAAIILWSQTRIQDRYTGNPVSIGYKISSVPGPFFRANALTSTTELAFRVKTSGEWNEYRNLSDERYNKSGGNIFKFTDLRRSMLEKYLFKQLNDPNGDRKPFQDKFQSYIQRHYLKDGQVDSLECILFKRSLGRDSVVVQRRMFEISDFK